MSVMVRKLYKSGILAYKMHLVAGKRGLDNIVKWVHILEDDNATSFLHGNELVFTAGIMNRREDWLLDFARRLHKTKTSAFVVNIGPHIKEIPQTVADYCDEVGLPLFTIPWETRMVDITRDFCCRIMSNEQAENDAAASIKNIIFNIGNTDFQMKQLERCGYQCDSRFTFVSADTDDKSIVGAQAHQEALSSIAETVAKRMHEMYIAFTHKESLVLVLINYTDNEVKAFIQGFLALALQKAKGWLFHIGVSANQAGILGQKDNFERALYAMAMARKKGERCCYYIELGICKVLCAVSDKAVLRDFQKSVLGKLESYDRENNTRYMDMAKAYFENNTSIEAASKKQLVHRNTVTNQLKKIEEITGYNPFSLEDKVSLYIALKIGEML